MVRAEEPFVIRTDAGDLPARVDADGAPSFELAPVVDHAADAADATVGDGEVRVGFATAGVPHLVVRVADVDAVDLATRGRELRRASPARLSGANVNFVSEAGVDAWRMRTFERGVEGETLACGTGAVACGAVLRAWGEAGEVARLITRSGRPLLVAQPAATDRGPVLSGEGRLVYEGTLRDWR
jgi:diaminopimelate epimerase